MATPSNWRIMTLSDSIYLQTSLNVGIFYRLVLLQNYLRYNDCSHFSFSCIFPKFVTKKHPLGHFCTNNLLCFDMLSCAQTSCALAARFTKRLFSYLYLCCFVQHLPSKRRAAAGRTSKMASGEVPRIIMKYE